MWEMPEPRCYVEHGQDRCSRLARSGPHHLHWPCGHELRIWRWWWTKAPEENSRAFSELVTTPLAREYHAARLAELEGKARYEKEETRRRLLLEAEVRREEGL
jgi:hypothetical protein